MLRRGIIVNHVSAKANLIHAPGERVWGVVYRLPAVALDELDVIEGGYERVEVAVETERERIVCHTYLSDRTTDEQVCFHWYRQHMIDGALERSLERAGVPTREEVHALHTQVQRLGKEVDALSTALAKQPARAGRRQGASR